MPRREEINGPDNSGWNSRKMLFHDSFSGEYVDRPVTLMGRLNHDLNGDDCQIPPGEQGQKY